MLINDKEIEPQIKKVNENRENQRVKKINKTQLLLSMLYSILRNY